MLRNMCLLPAQAYTSDQNLMHRHADDGKLIAMCYPVQAGKTKMTKTCISGENHLTTNLI